MKSVLIYGCSGWIATYIVKELRGKNIDIIVGNARVDDVTKVKSEIEIWKPSHVLCVIGRTYGPNINSIDYLEQPGKLKENIRDNLWAPISLAILCHELNIHLTYMGTGCIFSSSDKIYDENDTPDFFGSSYSIVKGYTDRFMHLEMLKDTVLNVRIRMPITEEMHPRNFITKIASYEKVCSISNSMTVLPTLIPYLVQMMEDNTTGTINLVNPGVISHNEILQMYKDSVDSSFTWENMSIEEQNKILKSERSNNELNTTKLQNMFPDVPKIHDAVYMCIQNIANKKQS